MRESVSWVWWIGKTFDSSSGTTALLSAVSCLRCRLLKCLLSCVLLQINGLILSSVHARSTRIGTWTNYIYFKSRELLFIFLIGRAAIQDFTSHFIAADPSSYIWAPPIPYFANLTRQLSRVPILSIARASTLPWLVFSRIADSKAAIILELSIYSYKPNQGWRIGCGGPSANSVSKVLP